MQIRVKVNASARNEGVRRLEPGFYQVRTSQPAEDGKANRRVLELLAEELGREADDLEILAGAASPMKLVGVRETAP